MAVSPSHANDNQTLTIRVEGRFDYSQHREFREAYRDVYTPGMQVIVDLSNTEYMDSSALGMLLLLREHAGGDDAKVVLKQPTEAIRKILDIAHFEQLFTID